MNGKEILNEEFERAGMRGGYRAEQVDDFLKTVASYLDDANTKNEDYAYKLKILADKIEEYKKDEGSIRDALLNAQKLGTSVVNDANEKAMILTTDAKTNADEMLLQAKMKIESLTKDSLQKANQEINSLKRECEREQRRLDLMKQEVSVFRSSILKQYKNHLDLLSNLPTVEPTNTNAVQEQKEDVQNQQIISDEISVKEETQPIDIVKEPVTPNYREVTPTISYTKATDEFPETKPELYDRAKNAEPIFETHTIKSDLNSFQDGLNNEIKLQTKEFNNARKPAISATEVKIDRNSVSPAIPFNPISKSTMAGKFAELDFGKNKN